MYVLVAIVIIYFVIINFRLLNSQHIIQNMSKRKATLASYEGAVRDILNFAEGDDGDIETIASPLVHDNVEFEQGEYEQSSDEEKGDQ